MTQDLEDLEKEENFIDKGYCLKRRLIYIDQIKEEDVNKWIRIFVMLEFLSDEPITIYLNSPGGSVYDGLALFDIIMDSRCWIETVALGKIMSMGLTLFLSGDKRTSYKNTSFMAHEVSSGTYGKANEIVNDTEEVVRLNENLLEILEERTKKSKVWWKKYYHAKDKYFDAKQAKKLGVIN